MGNSSWNTSAANTTNATIDLDLTLWEVDPDAKRPNWWQRTAAWIDNKIAHPLCWESRWIPGLSRLAFKYCQWAAKYDWPVYRKRPAQWDNRA